MIAWIVKLFATLPSLCAAVSMLYNTLSLEGAWDQLLQAVCQMTAAFVFVALLGSALGEDLVTKNPTVLGPWYTEQPWVCMQCQNEAVTSDRIPTRHFWFCLDEQQCSNLRYSCVQELQMLPPLWAHLPRVGT